MKTAILALYSLAGLLEIVGIGTIAIEVRRARRDAANFTIDDNEPQLAADRKQTYRQASAMGVVIMSLLIGNWQLRAFSVLALVGGIVVGTVASALSTTQ
jgi:hypothetical protein